MRHAPLLVVLGASALATGCTRYYEAELTGYIRDAVSKQGINRAVVQALYDDGEASSYQQTFTQRLGDQDGYFVFRRVVWSTATPLFGDEGDLHDVRVTVEHEDYQLFDRTLRIVSGASNAVGDVYLNRAFFVAGAIEGRVRDRERDVDGEQPGIDGLEVELYVPDVAIADEAAARAWVEVHNPDAATRTATIDGDSGSYRFEEVRFEVPGRAPAGEDERGTPWRVIALVQDADHFEHLAWDLEIRSGETLSALPDLFVDKKAYRGALKGFLRDRASGDGVNNATVEIYVPEAALTTLAEVEAYLDDHDPVLTTTSRTFEEEDGYILVENIAWRLDAPPDPASEHQRRPAILRARHDDFATLVLYRDPALPRFVPMPELISNSTVRLPDVLLTRTHFVASAEGYVRRTAGAVDSGVNGVRVSLYYDPQDPGLTALGAFDPAAVTMRDHVTTGNNVVADQPYPGFFRLANLAWDNPQGGALAGGKDALSVILYSPDLDFTGHPGNQDPQWQRFELVSGNEGNVLPDLAYRADATGFSAHAEGYVRVTPGDAGSGRNGVTLSLYYDPQDPDLSELVVFDPGTVRFSDVVTTGNQLLGDQVYAGHFRLSDLAWSNPDGPSLASGKDQLTVILYAEQVDFAGFAGNQDPHWQRFVLVSGDAGNALPDLPFSP